VSTNVLDVCYQIGACKIATYTSAGFKRHNASSTHTRAAGKSIAHIFMKENIAFAVCPAKLLYAIITELTRAGGALWSTVEHCGAPFLQMSASRRGSNTVTMFMCQYFRVPQYNGTSGIEF